MVTFHKLTPKDISLLKAQLTLYVEVFPMPPTPMPPDETLLARLNAPNVHFFIASHNEQVVGGLTAYSMPSLFGNYSEVYIYDLAVRPAFQRQGIGRGLIETCREWAKIEGEKGNTITTLLVQGDEADGYALEFYRAIGGIEEKTRNYDFPVVKP